MLCSVCIILQAVLQAVEPDRLFPYQPSQTHCKALIISGRTHICKGENGFQLADQEGFFKVEFLTL